MHIIITFLFDKSFKLQKNNIVTSEILYITVVSYLKRHIVAIEQVSKLPSYDQ